LDAVLSEVETTEGVTSAKAVIRRDGETVVVAGKDGTVRMVETETGKLVREFVPVVLE